MTGLKRRVWVLTLIVTLIYAVFVFEAVAQVEQGTITGTVTDPSGAMVPKARVTIRNVQTQVARETQTNDAGQYSVPYLHPGQYEVIVEAPGLARSRVADVNLTVGLTATINVTLTPEVAQTEVTVTANSTQLEQQSASLGNVVSSQQLIELPLFGRNPYSLVTLAPGVLPRGNTGTGPIIDGGRSNTSEVLLDGAESRNSTTNDIAYTPPLEVVQEFKLITNSMAAEFGRSGGGVITAATRSGANQWHGSIYEFLRNDKLNANSWTTNRLAPPDPRTGKVARSPFKRNEYGFTLGGPVLLPSLYDGHDKTFFFVNWEQTKQRSPDDIIATVPTELERSGDFSKTLDGRGNLTRIFDPTTSRPDPARAGFFIRDQFQGNRIQSNRIDPIALSILKFFPLPNRSTRTENFFQPASRSDDAWKLFFRVDHNMGLRHHLFFTFGRSDNPRFTRGINEAFPAEGTNGEKGKIESHPRTAVLSDTVTFGPKLIGEFRGSITRHHTVTAPRSVGFDYSQLGLPSTLISYGKTLLFPRIDVTDVASLGPDRASFFDDAENAAEAQAHVTWLQERHSVKAGFDFTFMAFNVFRSERPAGQYAFGRAFTQGPDPLNTASTSGFGVATFLLGAPTSGQITNDPSLAASQKYYAWYVQDDWKVMRRLTLNLGIRWEYQTPWTDRFNQLAFFDPNAVEPLSGQKGVLRFVGRDGNSRYQSDPDRNNFAPRLGLAWEFMDKTVLRAGYGLFYYPGSGGIGAGASDLGGGFLATTPVFLGQAQAAPNTPPPGASLANPFLAGFNIPPTTLLGSGVTTMFRDWITPFNHQWNLNIQRSVAKDMVVEVAYVGSRGEHIWVNRARNAVSTEFLTLGPGLNSLVDNPFFGKIPGSVGASRQVRRSQLLKPFPHYDSITRFRDPVGDSIYHGMTVRVDKRMGQGLSFQLAYTVSKLIDNVQERFGAATAFIDPNNLSLARSVSEDDRPQILVINYIYDLPFGPGRKWAGQGWAARLLGNWQVTGITNLAKGRPIAISGPNNTQLPSVSAYAQRTKSPLLPKDQQTLDRWFDTSAFLPADAFTLGTDSRTEPNLRGPGIKTFDIGLHRNQRIKERANLQFRAEFQNAFNTPQFANPVSNLTDQNFGRVTSGGSPRQIQFGLRLSF
ncbi:MAG TPA: carboxypeptidase regulatory-like domain-containing protein [Acidobacteriota bacterium]|nr:carboxypeptidase regulatory-like domain-containing protein [Acidobacteriota bacterium]